MTKVDLYDRKISIEVRLLQAIDEIERQNGLIELGAEKLTGFMGRCAEAEAALRDLWAMADLNPSGHTAKKHAEALRLAGIKL